MNERASIEIIAPSVDEAIARGLAEMRLSRDEVYVDVLDEGGPGEVGMGARQARIRLVALGVLGAAESPEQSESVRTAVEALEELLSKMRIRARVQPRWGEASEPDEPPPLVLDIRGDDLGMLIGNRGETLNALQYILRLVVVKELDQPLNLIVDVEGYRSRREQQLRRLAQRMAEQAAARGRTLALEPMPAAERRIIHLALRNHPSVYTQSVGEGRGRKVTIIPKPV